MPLAIRDVLADPALERMNFLNQVGQQFPAAISFAAGRPADHLFELADAIGALHRYVEHVAERSGRPAAAVRASLLQYSHTNGIVNELIARQLAADEGVSIDAGDVVVTNGCQEAMLITLLSVLRPGRDVLFVPDPTYVGITSAALIVGVEVRGVPLDAEGLDVDALAQAIRTARRDGLRPGAVYLIPDHDNPTGRTLLAKRRRRLLELASEEGLLVLEDSPYRHICFADEPERSLQSLDAGGANVVLLGSFAKTVAPGLRLGFVATRAVATTQDGGRRERLVDVLSRVKSFTSVTTSPLAQAILGGVLLEGGGSLRERCRVRSQYYRAQRDAMLAALAGEFSAQAGDIAWNRPDGGFFLSLSLPFEFSDDEVRACAEEYDVLCSPMHYFSISGRLRDQVRLAFSSVSREAIPVGIERFARFVSGRTSRGRAGASR